MPGAHPACPQVLAHGGFSPSTDDQDPLCDQSQQEPQALRGHFVCKNKCSNLRKNWRGVGEQLPPDPFGLCSCPLWECREPCLATGQWQGLLDNPWRVWPQWGWRWPDHWYPPPPSTVSSVPPRIWSFDIYWGLLWPVCGRYIVFSAQEEYVFCIIWFCVLYWPSVHNCLIACNYSLIWLNF